MAIIHPRNNTFIDSQEQNNVNSGSIIAEKLPEEDVRVIETTENGSQQNVPVFPGTQRRKLYFNPAYFERQLLKVCDTRRMTKSFILRFSKTIINVIIHLSYIKNISQFQIKLFFPKK